MNIASNPHGYKLGLDFGDTIAAAHNQGNSSVGALPMSKDPDFLNRPALLDAFESIEKLVALFDRERVFIVSRCSILGEEKIHAWLTHHQFWIKTGVCPEHIHFCRERHEKAPICAELGITHFIDDRLEVLACMTQVLYRYRIGSALPDISAERYYASKPRGADHTIYYVTPNYEMPQTPKSPPTLNSHSFL